MKKRSHPSIYYPIFLNISGKKCVVAGVGFEGGEGARELTITRGMTKLKSKAVL